MELDHVELDELRIRPSGNRPTDNLPAVAVFTWERITFRKTFRNVIQNKRDWDRDLNYVRSHTLQIPSQSRSGSAHCEVIFCSYCAVRADWFQNAHARITFLESGVLYTRITIQNAPFSRFKTRFESLIWNSFAFTWAEIRHYKSGKGRITFRNVFWNVIRSHVNRPNVCVCVCVCVWMRITRFRTWVGHWSLRSRENMDISLAHIQRSTAIAQPIPTPIHMWTRRGAQNSGRWLACVSKNLCMQQSHCVHGSNSDGSCILCVRMPRCNSDGHSELGPDSATHCVGGVTGVIIKPLVPMPWL